MFGFLLLDRKGAEARALDDLFHGGRTASSPLGSHRAEVLGTSGEPDGLLSTYRRAELSTGGRLCQLGDVINVILYK